MASPEAIEAPARVLLVDDHVIVRRGLASILELEPDITVVAEAGNRSEALDALEQAEPDVVLLDLKLSADQDAEGLELCSEIIERLAGDGPVRIERIVSRGEASPGGFWYDQDEAEFVVVLSGAARLRFADGDVMSLGPGDWVDIAPLRYRFPWGEPPPRKLSGEFGGRDLHPGWHTVEHGHQSGAVGLTGGHPAQHSASVPEPPRVYCPSSQPSGSASCAAVCDPHDPGR